MCQFTLEGGKEAILEPSWSAAYDNFCIAERLDPEKEETGDKWRALSPECQESYRIAVGAERLFEFDSR